MQINSISSAQAFSGAEKKTGKKAAIAAGITGAAVIGATVAAGLHGKKIAGEQVAEQGLKGLKKLANFVVSGAKDYFGIAQKYAVDILDTIKSKLPKAKVAAEEVTDEVIKKAGDDVNIAKFSSKLPEMAL